MYCTCGGKGEGFRRLGGDLWVCANCDKPTGAVFRKLTSMYAPYGTTGILSAHTNLDGRSILRWAMPDGTVKETVTFNPYPRKVGMDAGEALLQRTWDLLDSKMDTIKTDPSNEAVLQAKNEARGIAEALAILMQPFLTDATEIARHAAKRWKAKQAGEHYEVPGLAAHIWDPTKNWDGTDRVQFTPAAAKAPASKARLGKQLSPDEAASVKTALAAGMFTVDQLAATFKVSAAQIEACR